MVGFTRIQYLPTVALRSLPQSWVNPLQEKSKNPTNCQRLTTDFGVRIA